MINDFVVWQHQQIGENCAHILEVKASNLGNDNFIVEADGLTMNVSLAVYTKVSMFSVTIFNGYVHFRLSLLSSICLFN